PVDRGVGLADADRHGIDREVGQELGGDRLGQGLDEPEARRLDDAPAGFEDAPVVDGPTEVVVHPGRLEIELHLDVDVERLGLALLALEDAVTAQEHHVVEDDPIGHRTIASIIRAARTLASTSWTRTTSTTAAMPRAVVARVASSRWSAGRSRTRPSVDFRLVPSSTGRPSRRSVPSSRRSSRLCSGVLPNPNPGSTMRSSHGTPSPA